MARNPLAKEDVLTVGNSKKLKSETDQIWKNLALEVDFNSYTLVEPDKDDVVDPAKLQERDALLKKVKAESDAVQKLRQTVPGNVQKEARKNLQKARPVAPSVKSTPKSKEREARAKELTRDISETATGLSNVISTIADLTNTINPLVDKSERVVQALEQPSGPNPVAEGNKIYDGAQ